MSWKQLPGRGGGLGKLEGDCEGDFLVGRGNGVGETLLSKEPEGESGTGRSVDCVPLFSGMVKSRMTRHVLCGTTGVSKDCWLWRVASLEMDRAGRQAGGQCSTGSWFGSGWNHCEMVGHDCCLKKSRKMPRHLTLLRRHTNLNRIVL